MTYTVEPPRHTTCPQWPGLSESFELDSWGVKVSGQSGILYFKNAICKEMPSRVARRYYFWHYPVMAIILFWQTVPTFFNGHLLLSPMWLLQRGSTVCIFIFKNNCTGHARQYIIILLYEGVCPKITRVSSDKQGSKKALFSILRPVNFLAGKVALKGHLLNGQRSRWVMFYLNQ